MIALIALSRFCIVTHIYPASLLQKVILCEKLTTLSTTTETTSDKMDDRFWKYNKNKGNLVLDNFRNFGYISSYLRLNIFAWKRLHNISRTTNATESVKTILKSFYKVLLGPCSYAFPRQPNFFWLPLKFMLLTFFKRLELYS